MSGNDPKKSELHRILLPLMGEGITEATIVRWIKEIGSFVKKDEPLLEVSTDKVDTEIPAAASGYLLKVLVPAGATAAVNSTIAFLGDDPGMSIPDRESAGDTSQRPARHVEQNHRHVEHRPRLDERPARHVERSETSRIRATPIAQRIAKVMNLNLDAVDGHGPAQRITKNDVLFMLDQLRAETGLSLADSQTSPHSPAKLSTQVIDGQEFLEGVPVRREKMSKMRTLIAEHMVQSVHTSPHVSTTFEINMSRMQAWRSEHAEAVQKKHGIKITYTHLIAHACVQTIQRHPIVNVSVDGHDILFKQDINLGVAVALETGLIVPVAKKIQGTSLLDLGLKIQDLVVRARSKKLNPDEVTGGTFTITNPGLFGSLHSAPIINQPQVAILSVGAIIERPIVEQGKITVAPLVQIGLTFDHRVIDGEGGARFLADLKSVIENYEA